MSSSPQSLSRRSGLVAPLAIVATVLLLVGLAWTGLTVLTSAGRAEGPPELPTVGTHADPRLDDPDAAPRAATRLSTRLKAANTEQENRLARLRAAYLRADDHEEALEIQTQIRQTQREGERELLEIRLEHARALGREQTARRLEDALLTLDREPVLQDAPR